MRIRHSQKGFTLLEVIVSISILALLVLMISRVFNERERVEVLDAIDIMEDAIRFLNDKAQRPEERARAQFQEERIRELLDLARLGKQLLDALIKEAKVDGSPLMAVLLGGSEKR